LSAWHKDVEHADWTKWADVKAMYRSADQVGDCVVFNIGGNKYRLIARIRYSSHKVYVLKVLTHKQYDAGKWKRECGCYEPPPG
jgi:mRNA interferase HigB